MPIMEDWNKPQQNESIYHSHMTYSQLWLAKHKSFPSNTQKPFHSVRGSVWGALNRALTEVVAFTEVIFLGWKCYNSMSWCPSGMLVPYLHYRKFYIVIHNVLSSWLYCVWEMQHSASHSMYGIVCIVTLQSTVLICFFHSLAPESSRQTRFKT